MSARKVSVAERIAAPQGQGEVPGLAAYGQITLSRGDPGRRGELLEAVQVELAVSDVEPVPGSGGCD